MKPRFALIAISSALNAFTTAGAADITWLGSPGSLWSNTANWNGGAVPTSADNVFFSSTPSATSQIEIPSGATANGLTVSGASPSFHYGLNTGDLTLSDRLWVDGQDARLDIDGAAAVSAPSVTIGVSAGAAKNVLNVASSLSVAGTLNVGYDGTLNQLGVTGGTVTASDVWVGGLATSSFNTVTLDSTANLTASSQFIVGYGGNNNDVIINAGTLTTVQSTIGYESGSDTNTVDLSNGAQWTNSGAMTVGQGGSDNWIVVSNATTSLNMSGAHDVVIGAGADSSFNAIIVEDGGSFTMQQALVVGSAGDDNLFYVDTGATATSTRARIGLLNGSDGNAAVIDGPGSTWTVNGTIRVGVEGDFNSLEIQNGGLTTVTGGSSVTVGYGANGDNNALYVHGAGSELSFTGSGGQLRLSTSTGIGNRAVIADGGTVSVDAVTMGVGGILQIGNNNAAGTLKSTATITGNGGGVVYFNHTTDGYTFANSMTGPLSLVHDEAGRTILSSANTYTGTTTVFAGELQVTGSTAPESEVNVEASGTLSGSGMIGGNTTIGDGGTISPGNSPGTLTIGANVTWLSGGDYNWQIVNSIGTAGTDWDLLDINGNLDLSALSSANPFDINLWSLTSTGPDVSGNLTSFDATQDYTWTIATADGGITSFSANKFNINVSAANGTGGFTNNLGTKGFSVERSGNNLNLVFSSISVVPEPGSLLATAGLLASGLLLRRRGKGSALNAVIPARSTV